MDEPNIAPSAAPEEVIRKVLSSLAKIYHDTNNPLSIVSGNAQYFLEIAKASDVEDDLIQPVEDIEEASERVAEGLRKLLTLRSEIETYLSSHQQDGT